MRVCTRAFHLPKQGNAEDEYEDAYFPEDGSDRRTAAFRCAVADGASESAFAGPWARLLVRGFGRRRLRLRRLQRAWRRAACNGPLPWYLERKLRRGAHAAFVGLAIREGRGGSWRALAVGDSCLFQLRGVELMAAGPVQSAESFDNAPDLVSSRDPTALRRARVLAGAWRPGDRFLLATDALAQWMLAEHERGRPPWPILLGLAAAGPAGGDPFAALVGELRGQRRLRNDDTTLLCVEVS